MSWKMNEFLMHSGLESKKKGVKICLIGSNIVTLKWTWKGYLE